MKCPKCQIELDVCGQVDCDGEQLDVYQCDDCLVDVLVDGVPFPAALTFAVSAAGVVLDAATLEPIHLN